MSSSREDILGVRLDPNNPKLLLLNGKSPGLSQLTIVQKDRPDLKYEVLVQPDLTQLRSLIKRTVPTASVDVQPGIGNVVILSGYVTNPQDADIVARLANSAVGGNNANVINAIQVGGVQQVEIDVVIASIRLGEARAAVECVPGRGIVGDRFHAHQPGHKGQITFFSDETYDELCAALSVWDRGREVFRRNVITRGLDLNALIGAEFELQGVRFLGVSECKPCYWMDTAFAPGAEARLQGRGGLRAKVLSGGTLAVGPAPETLARIAPGIVWVCALLAALLAAAPARAQSAKPSLAAAAGSSQNKGSTGQASQPATCDTPARPTRGSAKRSREIQADESRSTGSCSTGTTAKR